MPRSELINHSWLRGLWTLPKLGFRHFRASTADTLRPLRQLHTLLQSFRQLRTLLLPLFFCPF